MIAMGASAAIMLGLTIFAFQTKIDYTEMGAVLLAVLICFVIFGLIAAFFPASRTLNLVYAGIGCIIFRSGGFLNIFPGVSIIISFNQNILVNISHLQPVHRVRHPSCHL